MIDVENMTSDEWLNYRDDLIDDFYAKGYRLIPNPMCNTCDVINNYVCFDCECNQLEAVK